MTLFMHYQEYEELGKEIGKEIGKELERRKIIVNMIHQGYNTEEIILICDTSKEEINSCVKPI